MANARKSQLAKLPTELSIFDIGAKTVENFAKIIAKAKSIVVSGTNGRVREQGIQLRHQKSLRSNCKFSKAFSLAGGGNTIAAIEEYGLNKKIGLH